MKRSHRFSFLFILLLLTECILTGSVSAGSEPRPNDSQTVALLFGDISGALPIDLTPAPEWKVGMEKEFTVLNVSTGIISNCVARIFLITGNIVFWIDTAENAQIPESVITGLQSFDTDTLPMLRETFGTENIPGMDNDPRFHVVFTSRIGIGYNGYFSADDSADPRIRPTSNGMDLLFLNTSLLPQGTDAVIDTLSHEFQHLIHFACDPNEMSFINEGFSGLAEYLALGRMQDIFVRNYLSDTGKSLVWWPDTGNNGAYYGSSFLFSVYLYDRFGADFIRSVVRQPGNGLDGIDQALRAAQSSFTADDVFQQWTAALLSELSQTPLMNLGYRTFRFPQNGINRDVRMLTCGIAEIHEVSQYGLRFYRSGCSGPCSITVDGNAESSLTALPVPGGNTAWWSGAVSNSIALLSRRFDLSEAASPVHFEYDAAYDIEDGYDYYYLLLKDGQGNTNRLYPSSFTDQNPAGLNLGGGTTGHSNGIRHESIDLSPWIGQNITLTFVYLTDTAGLADGLLLDNFRIDTIGFSDDAESSDNGWIAEGFSRIQPTVPQHFQLTVLQILPDGTAETDFYTFVGGAPFTANCPYGECLFGISAVDRNIHTRASFTVLATLQKK